ncbi:MAG: hypothetical protein PHU27_05275 [Salinivirgaceae bacterium]|nr:hypothetical protein [Salinivirgaceae bacterium]MDD4746729.1 hypothetical protein [Salinivirgaceae bacterium]MDY0280633.1 hypothetical protein [Salinivirgaceae bacterium]
MDRNAVAIGTMQEVADNDEPPLLEAPYGDIKFVVRTKPKMQLDLFSVRKQNIDLRTKYYPKVSQTKRSIWKWQTTISIPSKTLLNTLFSHIVIPELEHVYDSIPLRITPYYASRIDSLNVVGLYAIPSSKELHCQSSV